ncbi:3-keto-steroid reductase [Friedmanniomyces endolithicus]|nr:3-keto-steroid reductase [Friedmanniomyces endolithicus]KAK0776609.1 3-keto-steroid reductase [Friedmanniomyces endolithicus]KAK0782221.1 3-keto-steroid reductase [Friedmanniomyces endolithicus]
MQVQREPDASEHPTTFRVLVTGANSGLGFAICCRLIDEFLHTRPPSQTLHLLYTTRDARKVAESSKAFHAHLSQTLQKLNRRNTRAVGGDRVIIEGILVDLAKLHTVKSLATELVGRGEGLDAVIWNAGIAGWKGVDWFKGMWGMLTDLKYATTYPEFMIPDVGLVAAPQTLPHRSSKSRVDDQNVDEQQPQLGQVFLANVFGHYLLTHFLAPLFTPSSRIVWISSTGALPPYFDVEDLQGLRARAAYESSKRVTDLLALTSELPSTAPYVRGLLGKEGGGRYSAALPKMYVTHPGVIATSIAGLNWFMGFWMLVAMYAARWLSSPWHPVDPYKGAISAVFCALSPPEQLADLEAREGKGKWGSTTGVYGEERVARTEVPGWGNCGVPGVVPEGSVTTGMWRGRVEGSREGREGFEVEGARVWREMEELRREWEERIGLEV